MPTEPGTLLTVTISRASVKRVYPKAVCQHMNGWNWVVMYYHGPALCAAQRSEEGAWRCAAEYVANMIV